MAKYNFVLLLTIFTLFSCVKHGETVITLLDSNTKTPIEGAILFNEGSTLVLRSDVHGAITLPPALLQEKLTIHAKGYRALQFLASITTDTLQLQFEKELVNPVEAKMVFPELTRCAAPTDHFVKTTIYAPMIWMSKSMWQINI